jgi:hypothetical protein
VTLLSSQRLQSKAAQLGVPFGSASALPSDRAVLRNIYTTTDAKTIGEGSRVVYVGYIVKAKAASSEPCNCGERRREQRHPRQPWPHQCRAQV